jgi:uncharacterized protein (DUF1330 family)
MAAYVISDVEPRDAALLEQYRKLAAASVEQHRGRYLVRGGESELVEGGPPPKMIILVEFPSLERAQAWYRSPETRMR